jgi:four helix bundle protein
MGAISKFEEIRAWQEARALANFIHELVKHRPFRTDFDLRNQIQRASSSVMHNIAEGYDSGSRPEFIRFLRYARRSAGEVQSQLYLALDRQYLDRNQFVTGYDKAALIKKQINAFISYLKATK